MRILYAIITTLTLWLTLSACNVAKSPDSSITDVTRTKLVGTWQATSGDVITIGADSSITEENCDIQGSTVNSVTQDKTCPTGEASCGTLAITIVNPGNDSTTCLAPGRYICTFSTTTEASVPSLSCANGTSQMKYQAR